MENRFNFHMKLSEGFLIDPAQLVYHQTIKNSRKRKNRPRILQMAHASDTIYTNSHSFISDQHHLHSNTPEMITKGINADIYVKDTPKIEEQQIIIICDDAINGELLNKMSISYILN